MSRSSQLIYALSFIIAGSGFLLPFWPLCVVGLLIPAFAGRWIFAILTGLLLDLAWGAPQGMLHYVYLPFTLVAALAALIRYFSAGYFLDRSPSDTL